MKRILTISLLTLAVIFTVNADRRRLLMTRNVAAASSDLTVTNGLFVWLEADDVTGSDTDPVTTWPAHGYTNVSPTNSSGANRPIVQVNALGSHRAVKFATTTDFLRWSPSLGVVGTAFFVFNVNTENAVPAILDANSKRFCTMYPNGQTVYAGDGNDLFGSSFSIRVNGAATATFPNKPTFGYVTLRSTAGTVTTGPITIGKQGSADVLLGGVVAILLFDSVLSDGDRNTVESYIASKFGL